MCRTGPQPAAVRLRRMADLDLARLWARDAVRKARKAVITPGPWAVEGRRITRAPAGAPIAEPVPAPRFWSSSARTPLLGTHSSAEEDLVTTNRG